MKIVFIGCVESSYVLLGHLLENGADIQGVVTMKSSSFNADFKSLEPLAESHGIPCLCTDNINGALSVDFIKSKQPDIIYCFGWSRLIGQEILDIPAQGVVGFHPAALPANKGRHPIIWALALGLESTASTFFLMDAGADSGDIISQVPISIQYEDDASTLYQKILDAAKQQVLDFTKQFANGTTTKTRQDKSSGNTWRKRGKPDGQIDWRMSTRAIYNLVRALTHPYVGAHFVHGDNEVRVWKCEEIRSDGFANIEPGKVIQVNNGHDFTVKAYDGLVHILSSDNVNLKKGEYLP